jgi:hypothetical protein
MSLLYQFVRHERKINTYSCKMLVIEVQLFEASMLQQLDLKFIHASGKFSAEITRCEITFLGKKKLQSS